MAKGRHRSSTPRPRARAGAAGTPPVTSARTGLQLDPADPDDARIMARQQQAARDLGRQGGDRGGLDQDRPDLLQAYDEGAADTANTADPAAGGGQSRGGGRGGKGGGSWRPTLRAPGRAQDAGGFAMGLLLYTAAITWVRYGPAGWTGWLSAKFLNKPLQGKPAPAGAGPNKGMVKV